MGSINHHIILQTLWLHGYILPLINNPFEFAPPRGIAIELCCSFWHIESWIVLKDIIIECIVTYLWGYYSHTGQETHRGYILEGSIHLNNVTRNGGDVFRTNTPGLELHNRLWYV